MPVSILRGDARALPLADQTIDLVVTSPPYFGLRSYQDGGQHYAGQIGDEASPGEFVDSLIAATREMVRVLKPSGSIWVNLGDKYVADNRGSGYSEKRKEAKWAPPGDRGFVGRDVAPRKSLLGVPWRYALRCIDELGLILRAEVIWCLSGGARVYARTATGDRPIMLRDLVRSYQPENVQLWNGDRWTQVLGWNRTPDDDGALEFELRSGERIGCTSGHRWPTQRGVIRADEIRVGDVIATTRLPEPAHPRTPALLPDEDIGWLVGLYIAEGSRSETTVQIAGHVREDDRHARLTRIAEALDGTCAVYRTGGDGVTANLRGSVIVSVIDRYVSPGTAKTKRLRHAAWQRSDAFLAAVVDGYLSGDGHYDEKNDRWRLGFTENDEWACDLRTLSARLGTVLRLRRAQHTGNFGTFPGWRGEWRWTRSTHHNVKSDSEVVAIRRSRARDFYDVGVADDPHLFALASGVLTHNSKPNGLPESVQDRVRRSHEQWFHFTVQPHYFSAVDEVREEFAPHNARHNARYAAPGGGYAGVKTNHDRGDLGANTFPANPLGKLPGSVWTIPTQPLRVPEHLGIDHFAAFPMEWPRRIILGWSPRGVCVECGFLLGSTYDSGMLGVRKDLRAKQAPGPSQAVLRQDLRQPTHCEEPCEHEVPQTDDAWLCGGLEAGSPDGAEERLHNGAPPSDGRASRPHVGPERSRAPQERDQDGQSLGEPRASGEGRARRLAEAGTQAVRVPSLRRHDPDVRDALSCPNCGCGSFRPAVIADPFGGTGTTALVADALGRHGISNDMSADYCRLAQWRTTDPGERARALQVDKPPIQVDGQQVLL